MQPVQHRIWESIFFGVLEDCSLSTDGRTGAYAVQKRESDYRFIICYRSGMKVHATDVTSENVFEFLSHYSGPNRSIVSINSENFVLVHAKNVKLSVSESTSIEQVDISSLRSVYAIIQTYETQKQDFKSDVNARIKHVNQIIGVLEKDYHKFKDVS
jgi:hypothetical protein